GGGHGARVACPHFNFLPGGCSRPAADEHQDRAQQSSQSALHPSPPWLGQARAAHRIRLNLHACPAARGASLKAPLAASVILKREHGASKEHNCLRSPGTAVVPRASRSSGSPPSVPLAATPPAADA